ncbi:hypothetical protein IQ250_10715 [Pseudanabaenaceae cyanobacterium LEGE 13415]|nr:hypothetical protein [Pseudanabaenaceae cyanobacterium LEGE 13415]
MNQDDAQKSPVGMLVGDAEILKDLDRVIQNGQEEEQSSCGCSTPCSCSGAPCSCGSETPSNDMNLSLFDDFSDSFLEFADFFENTFSSRGSTGFEQVPMQEFLATAEQALNQMFDAITDRTND